MDPRILPLDQILDDFHHECLYEHDSWFCHRILTLDREAGLLRVEVDTTRLGPLVTAQRVTPAHPKHFPGAIAVQLTGTLGQLWAVYGMGLRATEGWSGFGTHIHDARFQRMGEIGPPAVAEARCTRQRKLRGTWFTSFEFQYLQHDKVFYSSKQTAAWVCAPSPQD